MALAFINEEQRMIQTMARDFAREVLLPGAGQRDREGRFPADMLARMAELGFLGMMVPEEYGGAGVDAVSYVLALAEIAYGCASTAVVMSVHNSICCEAMVKFGSEEQKRQWLPPMCDGRVIGAFGLTEPGAGSDPSGQITTAVRDGDYWVLSGVKQFITTGSNAGLTIVTAYTDKSKKHRGVSAFLVPKGSPGLVVGKAEDKLGLKASDTVQLILEDCRVPAANMLGREGEGFRVAMTCLDAGRIGIAAQSLGVARACLDEAVTFIDSREQFGRAISQFQGVRWRIADMATEIEAAELLCVNAALLKAQGQRFTAEASMAKLFASEMVNRITSQCLQLHGGYGFCKEYDIERHFRDARVFTIYEGTSEIQRVVISNHVLGPQRVR
ncbi:acyl-CoA dehydrogenase domain protein [Desulfarculus baarsii DSM 2075]|uniref:Cyclohexane-1-carbonyl-CoA dehydrogenase n=1 Tax=Desulfarculus baarsii (strain ATCC 33931 / DSM 2075 / LMG 7858 / VKM B-1802 / 2st14) TaxID=644282 RepID=E1QG43_DESB2|nr:acyl-CoA dehydrogenase [Desulfarculus baarsii]ADK84653.1 acyl-CoA dehydrogenase domain protein [Desulfarculus baarsii DSM 2075]